MLLDYFRPLPPGVTSATLRRARWVCSQPLDEGDVLVRVFAPEDPAALTALLSAHYPDCFIQVYVYPLHSHEQELLVVQSGQQFVLKKGVLGPPQETRSLPPLEEAERRSWRDVLQSYIREPYLIDVPSPETNHLFQGWLQRAEHRQTKPVLMDDLIDAVYQLVTIKHQAPVDEAHVVQTTALCAVAFAASLRGLEAASWQRQQQTILAAYPPGLTWDAKMEPAIEQLMGGSL